MAPSSRPLCADTSREAGEPLGATASRVDHWLLVEYPGRWSRDVLGGSALPRGREGAPARAAREPAARAPALRPPPRPARRRASGTSTASAAARARAPRIACRSATAERARGHRPGGGARRRRRSTSTIRCCVVCTHGKRDRCCARYGRPLYDALRASGRRRVGLAEHARRRRPVRRQPRLPAGGPLLRPGRAGRDARQVLAEYAGRAHRRSSTTAAARATRSRSRRPSALVREAHRAPGDRRRPLRVDAARRRARLDCPVRGGRATSSTSGVVREDGEPALLTCDATGRSGAAALRRDAGR